MYARISQGISQGAYARHLQGLCTQCSHLQAQLGGGGVTMYLHPPSTPHPPFTPAGAARRWGSQCTWRRRRWPAGGRHGSRSRRSAPVNGGRCEGRGSARIQKPPKRTAPAGVNAGGVNAGGGKGKMAQGRRGVNGGWCEEQPHPHPPRPRPSAVKDVCAV